MTTNDDDYIPFEGPLWDSRGPRKVSEAEAAQLQETLQKIRQRQAERHQAAKERVAASDPGDPPQEGDLISYHGHTRPLRKAEADRIRELVQKLRLNEPGRMRVPGRGEGQ
jgi:hypothetical protein